MGYSLTAVQAQQVLDAIRKGLPRLRAQALFQAGEVFGHRRRPLRRRWSGLRTSSGRSSPTTRPRRSFAHPAGHLLLHEDEYRASKGRNKPILILARPCDINAQEIQAKSMPGTAGMTDYYYPHAAKR